MALKPCRYNFFFKTNDGFYLAYNAFSNSMARIPKDKYRIAREILKNPNNNCKRKEKDEIRESLMKGNFLLDEHVDEIEVLKMRSTISRFSKDYLGLTIAPTLDCNFKCSYCFEDRRSEKMNTNVIETLIKFVEKKIDGSKQFSVTWFGGEPLLELETIKKLTRAFQSICQKYNVKFPPSTMITNGYLLSARTAKVLKELNITNLQITIDGPKLVHDKRRLLRNGNPTFQKIIDNIRKAIEYMKVIIRVNLDEENFQNIPMLFQELEQKGLAAKVPLYIGRVVNISDACTDIASSCFKMEDFSSAVVESIQRTGTKNIKPLYPMLYDDGVCCADKLNSYVITPNGFLFKCWSEVSFDESNSVGNIFETELKPYQMKNLTKYLNWNPFEITKCRKCKYLPICSGGCPFFYLNNTDHCTPWKFYMKDMLLLKYEEIKKRKKK